MKPPILPFSMLLLFAPLPGTAADPVFFKNPVQTLQVRNLGLAERKVPVYHGGRLIRRQRHEAIEGFFRVGKRRSTPQLFADLAANTYFRPTYQKRNGRSGRLGTSIATSPAYRTGSTLDLVPDVSRATVYAKGPRATYRSKLTAAFPGAASLTLHRELEAFRPGRSRFNFTTEFRTLADLALSRDAALVGNDRFRVITLSSMFADRDRYDADEIRYEALGGEVRSFPLRNTTPRGAHLFPAPVAVGSWIELVKHRGSDWNPDSPSIRIVIKNGAGLRLGIQGFLDTSTNPNDDSLSVWLEWLDAPDSVPSGTAWKLEFEAIASPPA